MQQQVFEYQDGETVLEGFYAYDETKGNKTKKPVMLICHDWSGCNELVREKAKKIAELGYLGFALDMYGKGKRGHTKEEKMALMQPLMNDRQLLRQRVQAAFTAAKTLALSDHDKIAIMGYCFGGLCALDLARSGAKLSGAISFHGLLNPPEALAKATIQGKILVLHGYDDPMVPPQQVNAFAEEMTTAAVDWQIHIYGHTMHAFANPEANDEAFGTLYNKSADQRSWRLLKDFLNEIFE